MTHSLIFDDCILSYVFEKCTKAFERTRRKCKYPKPIDLKFINIRTMKMLQFTVNIMFTFLKLCCYLSHTNVSSYFSHFLNRKELTKGCRVSCRFMVNL